MSRSSTANRSGVGSSPRPGRPRRTTMRVLVGIMSRSVVVKGGVNLKLLALGHRRVALGPCLLHESVGDPPPVGGPHDAVLVVAADDEVVAAGHTRPHVLALELTAVRRGVAVDDHLMVADEVLRAVEPQDRSADT